MLFGYGLRKNTSCITLLKGLKFHLQHHFVKGLLEVGILCGAHFGFWRKRQDIVCQQNVPLAEWLPTHIYPAVKPSRLNQVNLGDGKKKGHLALPWWNLDKFWATDGCLTVGCQVALGFSIFCFGQVQNGISGDTNNFFVAWPSGFYQKFGKHRP